MDLLDLIAQGDTTPTRPKSRPGGSTGDFVRANTYAFNDEHSKKAEIDVRRPQAKQDDGWGHLATNTVTRAKDRQLGRDLGFSQDSDRTFDQLSVERPKTTGVPSQITKSKSKYNIEDSDDEMSGVGELLDQLERKHTTYIEKREPDPVITRAQTAYIEPKQDSGIATLTSQRSRIKRTISSAGTRPNTAEPKSLLKTRNSLDSATEEKPGDVVKHLVRETRFAEEVKLPSGPGYDDSRNEPDYLYARGDDLRTQDLLKLERDRADQERVRLEFQHKDELERREKQFEVNLQRERKSFEKRLAEAGSSADTKSLREQLNAQQDMLVLLQEQLTRTNQAQEDKKVNDLDLRERNLVQQEQRLFRQAQMLEQDKQRLLSLMQQLEQSEAERRTIFEAEQETLRLDRDQLRNFQKMLVEHDKQRKSENAIERQKLDLMREQLERERDQIQEELEGREKDLSLKETLLEQKRDELFRQIKDERLKLQKKSSLIDGSKVRFETLELEIMSRIQRIEEQERNSKGDWEKAERTREALENEKRDFDETAEKVRMLSLEIQRETEVMVSAKDEIERERAEIEQMRYEAQVMAEQGKAEHYRAEMAKKDLLLQQKRYEEMRVELVSDMHVRHKSAIAPPSYKEFETKFEPIEVKRQQPTQKRPNFTATSYLKDLEQFDRARSDFTSYITDENQRLLRTKLEMETGFTESLAASSRPAPSDSGASSFLGDSSRYRDSYKSGSISRAPE